MKRCSGLILLLVLLLFSGSTLTAAETPQKQTNITCSAQSPVDGSLWMGTSGDGLLRMGRNGRHILYNKSNGQLSSDVIKNLSFEPESNVLIILDGNGTIWTYSSTAGFKEKDGFASPVLCLQRSFNGTKHYAATAEKLYVFSSSTAPEERLNLPFAAERIVTGEDGSLWIITKNGALHIDENLNITQQNGDFTLGVSESNPFVFETSASQIVTEGKAQIRWPLVLILVLVCALGIYLYFRFAKSGSGSASPAQKEEKTTPAESEPSREESPEVPINNPSVIATESPVFQTYQLIREKMEASPFGASVLSLIDSHLDNPNYGVEQISEDLGLSRIHLNRRLKAETDFSPSTVLKAVRMNQAVQLLMDGNHTIAEIASSCGFSTASYFSTAFKDYFGASPSDYMGSR